MDMDVLRRRLSCEEINAMDCLHSLSTRLHIFEFSAIRFPALQMARTISSMQSRQKPRNCRKAQGGLVCCAAG